VFRCSIGPSALMIGTLCACPRTMGAKRVEDLVVWQLANQLRVQVHAMTAHSPAHDDGRFCSQLRDSASGVTRNIAEGFGRYRHREFAQYLSIARGSTFEVADHLRDGVARHYWSAESVNDLHGLCNRTIAALTRFIRYLKNHKDP
jgi:four helix bundle protein